MVYLTKDTQNRQSFLPNIWLKLVGHISDWVFVAPIDIGSALLVDMQPYGYFILKGRHVGELTPHEVGTPH